MEFSDKDLGQKKIPEIKTFPVPLALGEIKENFTFTTNSASLSSKEEIINQAFKFHSEGKTSEAKKYYQLFINQGFKDQRVFFNYGSMLKSLGNLQEAETFYRKAIELNPDFTNAHYNLGNLLRDLGNLEDAETSYRKTIKLNPDFTNAHLNLGNLLGELGKFKEAELSHRKAIELNPDLANAYLNLGNILRDLGKSEEAEKSYRKAIELNPDYANAHYNLGSLLRDLGKSEEAEKSYRKAIQIKPDFAIAHSYLGSILIDLGKLEEAEVSTRKASELDPKSAKCKLNLGINQFARGDINSSLATLELAYGLDQNDLLINTLLAILKERKKNKPKNLRVENIRNSLFIENSEWTPIVLYRPVEAELIQKLYSLKTQESSRPIYGNIKGSDYSLFEKDIPILRYFQKDLIKKISNYFDSEIYIAESFFNIITPKDGVGGGSKIHKHLNGVDTIPQIDIAKQKFSLVYYLSVGDKSSEEQGILRFHNPNKNFIPDEGMIVIFPASRLHSVYYDGNKDRVVIVVNFYLL